MSKKEAEILASVCYVKVGCGGTTDFTETEWFRLKKKIERAIL